MGDFNHPQINWEENEAVGREATKFLDTRPRSRRTTQVWNKLLKNVVKAENTKDFKRQLDKHMCWP